MEYSSDLCTLMAMDGLLITVGLIHTLD